MNQEQASKASEVTPLWHNPLSLAGIFLIIVAIVLLMTFCLFSLVAPSANPYLDIFGFLILPGILLVGMFMAPIGILIKSWRRRRHDPEHRLRWRWPKLDLSDPVQRKVFKSFVLVTFLILPVLGVSGYQGYHYTESAQFCAKACHSVMEPQATTYEYSSHARVSCAQCHIGEGAGWFVKSKLSGTRQVFATLLDTYPRPIPPAITNLRPARETCEHCHWPQKFYGAQLARIVNFGSDESNTRRQIDMLLKIGGGDKATGRAEGIHLHMALAGQIEYIATDNMLQNIPWVQYTDNSGIVHIYRSDGRPTSDPRPQGQLRQLDCMDCHNRPAHKFRSPDQAVDIFLDAGRMDAGLPFVKREAVAALLEDHPDVKTADARIGARLADFYSANYPAIWESDKTRVYQAVDMVREIYKSNFFPNMKVNWKTYPDNIGHKISAGCFRCHAGRHVDQNGRKITHDCHACHSFLNPVKAEKTDRIIEEGEFVHPYALEGVHTQLVCHQCHTGGEAPQATCEGCHSKTQQLRSATLVPLSRYNISPSPMNGTVDCLGCHDLSQPRSMQAIDVTCRDCHDDEPEKYDGLLARWSEVVTGKRNQAREQTRRLQDELAGRPPDDKVAAEARTVLQHSEQVLELLDDANPLHNFEASCSVYEQVSTGVRQEIEKLKATSAASP